MNTHKMVKATKYLLSDLFLQPPLRIDFSDDPQNNLTRINRALLRNKAARIIWGTYTSILFLILLWLTIYSLQSGTKIDLSLFEDLLGLSVVFWFRPRKIHAGFLNGIENILLVRELFSSTAILKRYWNAVVEEKRAMHELEIVAAQKYLEKMLSSQKISGTKLSA